MAKEKTKTEEIAEAINNPLPVEMKDSEGLPVTREKKEFKTLISGAEFKMWDEGEVWEGYNTGTKSIREKDGKHADVNPNEKAGSVMGYIFKQENGTEVIIGNSHQIQKAMELSKPGEFLRITYLGKTDTAGGQTVNRFKIEVAQ